MSASTAATGPPPGSVPEGPVGRLYLPELDGMRFFAFLLVFLFHLGAGSPFLSLVAGKEVARWFRENGWVGVQLFFILSGFLITTLLLREEADYGRVDPRAFWMRRILRIWPLYYLTVAVTFGLMPWLDGSFASPAGRLAVTRHLPWFLAFAGNWSMIAQGPVQSDAQSVLWSVCVEEQFYLLVPLVVTLVGPRPRVPLVALAIAASVAARAYLARASQSPIAVQYNSFAQADTLLSGVLLALLLGPDPRASRVGRLLRWLQAPILAAAVWGFTRPHLAHGDPTRRTWDFVAIWLVGAGLVAVAVTVPGWLRSALAYRRFVWLGKISYGLYMFHEVGLWLSRRFGRAVGWFPNDQYILPILALGLTVGLASASYFGYERRFLRLKARWSRVLSRPV